MNAHTTNDMFRMMSDNFSSAMRNGMKFQEDALRFWNDAFTRSSEQFRVRMGTGEEMFPVARKNADRFAKIMDEQTSRNLDLLRQAIDAAGSQNFGEMNDKFAHIWRSSFDGIRHTAEAFALAGKEMLDCCMDMTRGECNSTGAKPSKPAAK